MTLLAAWLAPVTMRLLALALLHFLWQGAALAALAYVGVASCRSAATRYAVGVGARALMFAAPVSTFLIFQAQEQVKPQVISTGISNESGPMLTARNLVLGKQTPLH